MMTGIEFPPGPRLRWPVWYYLATNRDPLGLFPGMVEKYGDMIHFSAGKRHFYFFQHPDEIEEVLVTQQRRFIKGRALQKARWVLGDGLLTSEGDLHLQQRRAIQPLFHRQRIAHYAHMMVEQTERMMQGEDSAGWHDGQVLDMHEAMMQLTLVIVAQTLFDTQLSAEADEVRAALNVLTRDFARLLIPLGGAVRFIPTPRARRFTRSVRKLDAIVAQLIRERQACGNGSDLLSMLVAAHVDPADTTEESATARAQQIRDEVMTLLLAGHETTANALCWTWHLLAQHPAAEATLHTELDRVLGDRSPTYADLEQLPYTRQVLQESLRLYPTAWLLVREAIEACEIGGYTIPPGATLLMSPWATHHDPRFFADPERFEPARWATDAPDVRPKFAYFPFGGGSRRCIGEQFAWMEGTLVLATIASRWRLVATNAGDVQPQATITLRPRGAMPMRLQRRHG